MAIKREIANLGVVTKKEAKLAFLEIPMMPLEAIRIKKSRV